MYKSRKNRGHIYFYLNSYRKPQKCRQVNYRLKGTLIKRIQGAIGTLVCLCLCLVCGVWEGGLQRKLVLATIARSHISTHPAAEPPLHLINSFQMPRWKPVC